MLASENIWVFPEIIDFEKTADYTRKYRDQGSRVLYYFDLKDTISVHSSFIGLLISIKNDLEKYDGRLVLNTSSEIDSLFRQMKISDYFSASRTVKFLKITA